MTTEMFYLMATAVLAASLWVPFVVGVNTTPAKDAADFTRPPDVSQFVPWVHRAYRAHLNLLEQFLPFAVIVLIGHTMGVSTAVMGWAAAAFFWLRVAHAVGMITGWTGFPARPIIFTTAWIAVLVIAWEIVVNA